MQSSPQNNAFSGHRMEKEIIFDIQSYKFTGSTGKGNQLAKTFIKRKFSQEQLSIITRLYHKNIIGLKKIAKSKKSGEEDTYWLYYENVPYSLDMVLCRNEFDVRPENLEAALADIKNYLLSVKITPTIVQMNIGVNENGVIKVYLSVESVLKPLTSVKTPPEYDRKIKEIKNWYGSLYSRRSIKPSSQLPPPTISTRRLSQSKLSKLVEIKYDIEKIRKKIKSEESKNNSVMGTPQGDKKIKLMYSPGEASSFTINIYNEMSANVNEKVPQPRDPIKKREKEPPKIVQKEIRFYDYDEESVDTYQMEMGEDFEMPSMTANHGLRQTFLNSKKSWDTLTHKSPSNLNKKRKIHESAGKKDFTNIVQNNKKLLREVAMRQNEGNSDNKTVQEAHLKQKNWQSSTIKSALPPNIQDRVQQALMKTKNLMQMLKNTKSFSAGK